MWHLTIRCYKNPDRKQAYSAEVASGSSGSKGSNSDYGGENEQGTQIKPEESESSRGPGYTRGRGRGFFRGRGKTDGALRGGGHQMSFCKTEDSKESDDGIESIYQSKIDSSLNSDRKIKEGVCYFLKSRLPTDEGTVRKKDFTYRLFTKGNKVTLQLVVPEGFREKVLRLAHETLLTEHLGIKKTLDRVVSEFFGLEFVVMWLDFVNLVTVVPLRYL